MQSKTRMPISVYLLAICQALMMSSTSLLMTISALVGLSLADDKSLSTLPLSFQFLGLMLTSIPASLLMGKYGRKVGFVLASIIGFGSAALALWSILNHNFWLFAFASFGIGIFNGFGSYFRFTAAEVTTEENKNKAISYVLAGGVIAAFIGPNLANLGRNMFTHEQFAGAFVFSMLLFFLMLIVVLLTPLPPPLPAEEKANSRPLRQIISQPTFIVAVVCGMFGYAVMSYLMTATPLAMKHHGHALSDTAFVIQWHIVAMFAPSFVTGHIISRIGVIRVLIIGALLALACVAINLLGQDVWHFWTALIALGVSWNFLFIGATSLLTETYQPQEKAKVQAINDFLIFSLVTVASLTAGVFQHHFGWKLVNIGVLPLIAVILICLLWLVSLKKKQHSYASA